MCKGIEMKSPKNHLENNENIYLFGSDSLYMVNSEQEVRNVGRKPIVEISEYQVKEIVALLNVVWCVVTWSSG